MLTQPNLDQPPAVLKIGTHKRKQLSINMMPLLDTIKGTSVKSSDSKRNRRTLSSTEVFSALASPSKSKGSSDDLPQKLSVIDGEVKSGSERHSDQGKSTQGESPVKVYGFKEFVNKLNAPKSSKIKRVQSNTLKSILKESCNEPKLKPNIARLNIAKIKLSSTTPMKSPDTYNASNGYKHNHRNVYFFNDVLQKAKSVHSRKDGEVAEALKRCRLSIMAHSEWFSNSEALNKVCAMIREIEKKYSNPYTNSQLEAIESKGEELDRRLKGKQEDPL
eukprot:TRINITY_DN12827_c0_g3_i2.p1 TRINITY_DN12827_c0_g3~~TRINITY_DN12827_c0_g3_i2.p1  ORF type:complete len:276 (-),score=53.28 TRINITY_DN12827_c0_g3_i2:819-1646(-)